MAQIISANPDTGKATIKRTVFDVDLDEELTLVSCNVIRINDRDTTDEANPAWFTDVGLVAKDNSEKLESEHTAEFNTNDASSEGVEYFEYRITVTDGTFETSTALKVTLAGKGREGAAALVIINENGAFRFTLPGATSTFELGQNVVSDTPAFDQVPKTITVEHESRVYTRVETDDRGFHDVGFVDVNGGVDRNSLIEGASDGIIYDIAYDTIRDEIIGTGAFFDNELAASNGGATNSRWATSEGRQLRNFVFDDKEDLIYVREGNSQSSSLYKRRAVDGAIIEQMPSPPVGDNGAFFLAADFGSGYIFAVTSNAGGDFNKIARLNLTEGSWSIIVDGDAENLDGGFNNNISVDAVRNELYFGSENDGVYRCGFDGQNLSQIVQTDNPVWGGALYGLSLFVNPAE